MKCTIKRMHCAVHLHALPASSFYTTIGITHSNKKSCPKQTTEMVPSIEKPPSFNGNVSSIKKKQNGVREGRRAPSAAHPGIHRVQGHVRLRREDRRGLDHRHRVILLLDGRAALTLRGLDLRGPAIRAPPPLLRTNGVGCDMLLEESAESYPLCSRSVDLG